MVVFSSSGAWTGFAAGEGGATAASARPLAVLLLPLLLSCEGKSALVFEWFSIAALRGRIGFPAECPPVSLSDLSDSVLMWARAVVRGLVAPGRWHRARPEA
jgi:apolipoprotein N-acyltransferase